MQIKSISNQDLQKMFKRKEHTAKPTFDSKQLLKKIIRNDNNGDSKKKRGSLRHIQWYEPFEKKVKSMATGLVANETNLKKAEKYAKQLQDKLTRDYKAAK